MRRVFVTYLLDDSVVNREFRAKDVNVRIYGDGRGRLVLTEGTNEKGQRVEYFMVSSAQSFEVVQEE